MDFYRIPCFNQVGTNVIFHLIYAFILHIKYLVNKLMYSLRNLKIIVDKL